MNKGTLDDDILRLNMSALGVSFFMHNAYKQWWASLPWYKKAKIRGTHFLHKHLFKLNDFLFRSLFPGKYREMQMMEEQLEEADFY